ncbi:MAG: ATPase, T2SS/T4P/T4SS family [Armatimonadetes bacterium]|nr:ATPase, T2SS/T4P/T4SS family [Armatimonadota bacterium]
MQSLPRNRLGDILVRAGIVSENQLEWALDQQRSRYRRLGEILLEAGLVSDDDIAEAHALQMEMPFIDLEDVSIPQHLTELVPEPIGRTYNVVPVAATDDRIAIATANPMDLEAIDAVQRFSKRRVEPLLASESKLQTALDQVYGKSDEDDISASLEQAIDGAEVQISEPEVTEDSVEERRQSNQAPVIKAVNLVLQEAVRRHASDIHFEPRANGMDIRYRIDGSLQHIRTLPKRLQAAVISRLKIMADLDIAEKRVPQDGRISVKIHNKNVDLRISTLPVHYGERLVIRILDKSATQISIDKLGFGEKELAEFKSLIAKPYGIILVTGPTGSGKTTTLYSAISHIKSPETNIMTVEDPIEYDLDGINQSAVNVRAGLTFPIQLRAILRQDPDVIFVGEIRDRETATIAFQAAMTGHLVFSTLHSNDAASAITRLIDMGVEPFLVGSSVIGILAQRLVRLLCQRCKSPYEASPEELAVLGLFPDKGNQVNKKPAAPVQLYKPVGCTHCDMRGFAGRIAVLELMVVNEDIRRLTIQKPSGDQVRDIAVKNGMKTLREHAIDKVLSGLTTLDEARRKVFIEDE